ncbi:hypothetical protein Mapa_012544 [Marchantia paleacea]|nr:hypothetical protein Mapa_012544 [Marchantia paleacea]
MPAEINRVIATVIPPCLRLIPNPSLSPITRRLRVFKLYLCDQHLPPLKQFGSSKSSRALNVKVTWFYGCVPCVLATWHTTKASKLVAVREDFPARSTQSNLSWSTALDTFLTFEENDFVEALHLASCSGTPRGSYLL